MPDKNTPAEHPNETAARKEAAEREKHADAITKARNTPHPSQAIAAALGTEPHRLDRDALAAYHAGKPKVAQREQAKADDEAAQATEQRA